MERVLLSRLDEQLDSTEVAELCFLCSDVINRKRLEGIKDAKELFLRLEEKGLLENSSFLSQLLRTIHRADLFNMLENHSRQMEETDANPFLSDYRLMLYRIHEDLTRENLDKMKFLLKDKMAKRHLEMSSTALNVFAEMEKAGLISNRNVEQLHKLLLEFDLQLAMIVQDFMNRERITPTAPPDEQVQPPYRSSDQKRLSLPPSTCETQPSLCPEEVVYPDHSPQAVSPPCDDMEFYILKNLPRGLCVIINNEKFEVCKLRRRTGTDMDEESLRSLFQRFGFKIVTHKDLTANKITEVIQQLCSRDFSNEDALVVCVLSHGEKGIVYGTDGKEVKLEQLTKPFREVSSLFHKPKLFFIQACQNIDQKEQDTPCKATAELEREGLVDSDCSSGFAVPSDADILVGMATVPDQKSYRHTVKGSFYIQELCRQLEKAAESPDNDDINTVLTRVNREVNKTSINNTRQMPQPQYTLTRRLILRFVELPETMRS